ncbi:oligosaccharide flippase family protein [Bacteroides nordii]|uniref:oligosaccharide flippase family protein n=3 Tax=Bacteroides nordii TaxID=291645 RepID=UPI00189861C9|nr:oligosaccharide flippase family protein [Bacteroides nordii]
MLKNLIHRNKQIIENTGYLSFIEGMRMALPFVALPYLIRTVGANNYGLVIFAQTIISYFVIFINFGLDISAVKDVAENRDNPEKLNIVVSSVLLIKLILLIIAFTVLSVALILIPTLREHYLLYLFAFLTCFSEVLFPVWFFLGIEKMKYLAWIRISSITFYTICIFTFIHHQSDYEYIALFQSLGNLLSGILAIYFLLKIEKIRLLLPTIKEVKTYFNESIPFFVSRLSCVFNTAICKTLCGIFFSMQAVAAFDLVLKLTQGATVPALILNQSTYPYNAKNKNKLFAQKFFYITVLLSIFITVICYTCAPFIIRIFAGDAMPEAILILKIACIYIFCGNLTMYLGTPILVAWGYPSPFNKSVIYSTFLLWGICILIIIFNFFTPNTLILALGIVELYLLIYRLYYCYYYKIFKLRIINLFVANNNYL